MSEREQLSVTEFTQVSLNGRAECRSFAGTAAPTAGDWRVGDFIRNTAPTAGGTFGWVCVTAGRPGTWKTVGTIES